MTANSEQQQYKNTDHARTHRQLVPGGERRSAEIDADFDVLMEQGYVIIENLIPREVCEEIKAAGLSLLGKTGRNPFEGHKTQRVYNVLSKTRQTDLLATHPSRHCIQMTLFTNYPVRVSP